MFFFPKFLAQSYVCVCDPLLMAAFSCEGLAGLWDSSEPIRARLRDGQCLLAATKLLTGKDATIAACTQNADVLMPCCHRLLASAGKLPEIELLRESVLHTYHTNQRDVADSEVCDVAWDIKKMLRFIKRKASRQDVSLDL